MLQDPDTKAIYAHVYAHAVPVGTRFLHRGNWYQKVEGDYAVDGTGARCLFDPHHGCLVPREVALSLWPQMGVLRPHLTEVPGDPLPDTVDVLGYNLRREGL